MVRVSPVSGFIGMKGTAKEEIKPKNGESK